MLKYSINNSHLNYCNCSNPRPELIVANGTLDLITTCDAVPVGAKVQISRLFVCFWLRWVLVAARGLSLVAASGGYSSLRCAGFSLRWLLLLRSTGSRRVGFSSCGSRALECRRSSCGSRAQLLRGMWDLPGRGLESVSPALAGGFLTTAPPGKSLPYSLDRAFL